MAGKYNADDEGFDIDSPGVSKHIRELASTGNAAPPAETKKKKLGIRKQKEHNRWFLNLPSRKADLTEYLELCKTFTNSIWDDYKDVRWTLVIYAGDYCRGPYTTDAKQIQARREGLARLKPLFLAFWDDLAELRKVEEMWDLPALRQAVAVMQEKRAGLDKAIADTIQELGIIIVPYDQNG
jgi:hypothetical protein